jgi:replication factor A1
MTIGDLKPSSREVDLTFKVVEKAEPKEVQSKTDGQTHRVAEATVGDSTGIVLMTLWDDKIDSVEKDKAYALKNGYVSLFNNTIRLNIGRYGELSPTDAQVQVNMENNVSEKQHEREFRPRRFGGGGGGFRGGGGGYGGGGGGGYRGGGRGGGYGGRERRERRERW